MRNVWFQRLDLQPTSFLAHACGVSMQASKKSFTSLVSGGASARAKPCLCVSCVRVPPTSKFSRLAFAGVRVRCIELDSGCLNSVGFRDPRNRLLCFESTPKKSHQHLRFPQNGWCRFGFPFNSLPKWGCGKAVLKTLNPTSFSFVAIRKQILELFNFLVETISSDFPYTHQKH